MLGIVAWSITFGLQFHELCDKQGASHEQLTLVMPKHSTKFCLTLSAVTFAFIANASAHASARAIERIRIDRFGPSSVSTLRALEHEGLIPGTIDIGRCDFSPPARGESPNAFLQKQYPRVGVVINDVKCVMAYYAPKRLNAFAEKDDLAAVYLVSLISYRPPEDVCVSSLRRSMSQLSILVVSRSTHFPDPLLVSGKIEEKCGNFNVALAKYQLAAENGFPFAVNEWQRLWKISHPPLSSSIRIPGR